jgi:hypothetical protein
VPFTFSLRRYSADFRLVEKYVCGDAACVDALEVPVAAIGAKGDNRYLPEQLSQWSAHCRAPSSTGVKDGAERGSSGFSEHWFTGVSPDKGAEYWGTPHRIVLDYPRWGCAS